MTAKDKKFELLDEENSKDDTFKVPEDDSDKDSDEDKASKDKADKKSKRSDKKDKDAECNTEITIRLPKKIFKTIGLLFLFLLFLSLFFYLGRISADCATVTGNLNEEQTDSSSFFTGLFGSLKALFAASNDTTLEDEVAQNDSTQEDLTGNVVADLDDNKLNVTVEVVANDEEPLVNDTDVEETSEEETVAGQKVATSYKRASLAIEKPIIDWRGTWGKVTKLKFTINNREDGYIEPNYFVMMVEGYENLEKKFTVPLNSRKINAGQAHTAIATVEGGFSYSESSAGDLTSVDVTLILYDQQGEVIGSTFQALNLQG